MFFTCHDPQSGNLPMSNGTIWHVRVWWSVRRHYISLHTTTHTLLFSSAVKHSSVLHYINSLLHERIPAHFLPSHSLSSRCLFGFPLCVCLTIQHISTGSRLNLCSFSTWIESVSLETSVSAVSYIIMTKQCFFSTVTPQFKRELTNWRWSFFLPGVNWV